jgi:hypothetical protein
MSAPQNEDERIGTGEPVVGAAKTRDGNYEIGYGRPPKQFQFKKGKSGNPRGRPRKKLSKKDVWDQIMSEPMYIREEGKAARKITKYEGLCQAQLTKAIKGHTGAAKFVADESTGSGFGSEQENLGSAAERLLVRSGGPTPQSDLLFQNVKLELLSEEDRVDLARCAVIIDLGGDFTALSNRDFERAKEIANKGRGKDVTPQK